VTTTTTKCRRVLVVDDNLGLAENLAELVELRGHSAVVATSAEAALAEASAHPPDVLVTDYRLPGMSGAGLVRRLREAGVHAVAIVISAFTDDETIDDARRAGAAFVAKPVALEELARLVDGTSST
jgi:DNA-binding response OmpR family regulator